MNHFFKINKFRHFLNDASNERARDATNLQRCWNKTQTSSLDLLNIRASGLYQDVRGELDRADQDNNEYCLLLSNFADAIHDFVLGAKRLQEASE
jgi:hypothetical protein